MAGDLQGHGLGRRVIEELLHTQPVVGRGAGVSDDHQECRLLPAAGFPGCESPTTDGAATLNKSKKMITLQLRRRKRPTGTTNGELRKNRLLPTEIQNIYFRRNLLKT